MGRIHQHQLAYRRTQTLAKSANRPVHKRVCKPKSYTAHTLAQAFHAYHQICKTRQQTKKSMLIIIYHLVHFKTMSISTMRRKHFNTYNARAKHVKLEKS